MVARDRITYRRAKRISLLTTNRKILRDECECIATLYWRGRMQASNSDSRCCSSPSPYAVKGCKMRRRIIQMSCLAPNWMSVSRGLIGSQYCRKFLLRPSSVRLSRSSFLESGREGLDCQDNSKRLFSAPKKERCCSITLCGKPRSQHYSSK